MNEVARGPSKPGRAAVYLLLLIIALIIAPWPVAVWGEYGDADAAWDGVVALLWWSSDYLPTDAGVFVEERFRSSPLSIWLTCIILGRGWVEPSAVPWLMNVATAMAALATSVLLFFFLRWLRDQWQALLVLILLLSSPVFFRLRCYGLPTLPAFALLVGSLLCYEVAGRRVRAWTWLACSFVLLSLAVLIKVDVVLLGPVFVVIALRSSTRRHIALAAWIMPVAAVFCWHIFCRVVAPETPRTGETLQNWSDKWRLVPTGLIDRTNLLNMAMAPGFGTLALACVGMVLAVARRRFAVLIAVLACIVPTVLFWGMREMNSSRHNFWIVVPIAVLASAGIAGTFARRPGVCLAAVLAAVALNYFVGPRQEDFRLAPARFYAAGVRRAETVRRYHQKYEAMFEAPPGERVCLHSMREETAHALAVWLAMFDRSQVRVVGASQNDWRVNSWRNGREYQLWMPDQNQLLSDLSALETEGWVVLPGG